MLPLSKNSKGKAVSARAQMSRFDALCFWHSPGDKYIIREVCNLVWELGPDRMTWGEKHTHKHTTMRALICTNHINGWQLPTSEVIYKLK